jgi:hypothetical protein
LRTRAEPPDRTSPDKDGSDVSARDDELPEDSRDRSADETSDDPHAALNTPVSEIESEAEWQTLGRRERVADVTGMGRAQTSTSRGLDGDPVLRESDDERESRNPNQSTPRGVRDGEEDAMRRAEEHTGVPLTDDEPGSAP